MFASDMPDARNDNVVCGGGGRMMLGSFRTMDSCEVVPSMEHVHVYAGVFGVPSGPQVEVVKDLVISTCVKYGGVMCFLVPLKRRAAVRFGVAVCLCCARPAEPIVERVKEALEVYNKIYNVVVANVTPDLIGKDAAEWARQRVVVTVHNDSCASCTSQVTKWYPDLRSRRVSSPAKKEYDSKGEPHSAEISRPSKESDSGNGINASGVDSASIDALLLVDIKKGS